MILMLLSQKRNKPYLKKMKHLITLLTLLLCCIGIKAQSDRFQCDDWRQGIADRRQTKDATPFGLLRHARTPHKYQLSWSVYPP